GVYPDIVLVGVAVKAKRHPVELDGTENQLVSAEIQTAAEHHCHSAVAVATGHTSECATKQSVCVRREVALALRDHWTSRVGVKVRTGLVHATKISGYAQPTGEVHVGGT